MKMVWLSGWKRIAKNFESFVAMENLEMSKKQLVIKSYLPAIFEENKEEYLGEGYTPEVAKSFCKKALDMKKEYHSLNEEERQWITKKVLGGDKAFRYGFAGFAIVLAVITLVLYRFGIGNVDNVSLALILISIVFILFFALIVIPLRNRRILKRINFDKVQECVVHGIISGGFGQTRSRYYAILQWDEESRKFYEVLYMPSLSKCHSGDIVYHPYGMKYYIPKKKEELVKQRYKKR